MEWVGSGTLVAQCRLPRSGDVTVKVTKPSGSWKSAATGTVDEDGSFSVTISETYLTGTKVKLVFAGTDEAMSATSITREI